MEIATEADLLELDLARPERLGRSDYGVVLRVREFVHDVRIEPYIRGEEPGVKSRLVVTRTAVQPEAA
jgi:hypothetical protein